MSQESNIEWTDATWNPVRGCTKISPGCTHCYASTFAERFRGVPGHPYEQGFDLRLVPEKLKEPLRWKNPRMIFVNSMSDLFHKDVPDWYIAQVYAVMETAHWHMFQILTKRDERMRALLSHDNFPMYVRKAGYDCLGGSVYQERGPFWRQNQWQGVSVENKKHGFPRIENLLKTPATVRFISIEPLLERLDGLGDLLVSGPRIDWVIVGAESGHGARPMQEDWVRPIRDLCRKAGISFFLKQFATPKGKKIPLPMLDGKQWTEMPKAVLA